MVYYNDNDQYCCRVLRARIADGSLPDGLVDERDIRDVKGSDLDGYRQIHLFAGIGGFPLGFKWAGLPADFSVLTGGFPCQDISNAGKRAGIEGDRSGLWTEMCRLVREVRPEFVVVENVSALLGRGMGVVLGDLAESGYDAEWNCIPASAFGAPHIRNRVWIVAHARSTRSNWRACECDGSVVAGSCRQPVGPGEHSGDVADAEGLAGQVRQAEGERPGRLAGGGMAHANGCRQEAVGRVLCRSVDDAARAEWWATEPDVGRVAHGIPARVDRLWGLGNSIVPQIAEWIGRRLINDPD